MEYYSTTVEVANDNDLDRVLVIARGMSSYHRIYIDEHDYYDPVDGQPYLVEILFNNEHDATVFYLKL